MSADKAYSNGKIRVYLHQRGIRHVIPEKKDHKAARLRRGPCAGRPPGFNKDRYKDRNTVERAIGRLKQVRAVAIRYDKRGYVCLGTVTAAALLVLAPIVTGAKTQAGRLVLRQGWPVGSGIKHGGDGFDLNELAVIAEHGDTHQCAGHVVVTERVPDNLPSRHQVLPPVRGNENTGADDIVQ